MSDFFLPVTRDDLRRRGQREPDVIIVTGDAYVDHPAYGAAVIGRVLEAQGFSIGIIAQPDWRDTRDFMRLGRPRLFFGITSGNVDSMVANHTANKRPRKDDAYSPGGRAGLRPDRAVTVYANRVREAFPGVPIVLGGIEASMRRLAHYDYWDDKVRRSVLLDARGDILVYGMAEPQILEIARRLAAGEGISSLDDIRGTAIIRKDITSFQPCIMLPSYEAAAAGTAQFNEAFRLTYGQQNPCTARPLVQEHGQRYVICLPPPLPMAPQELDRIYELPYQRRAHPAYGAEKIPGLETVRFSLLAHRGCPGECSFCSLYFHQGRIVQSRSPASLVREAECLSRLPEFKGTITDIGGPTANLYAASCAKWPVHGFCAQKSCLAPQKCKNLDPGFDRAMALYRQVRELPGVKHAFIGSGIRFDLLADGASQGYLEELCCHHISGQMKVAPEHAVDRVLQLMNKPPAAAYEAFLKNFSAVNRRIEKPCYLVNYFICGHPGTTLRDALDLALYLAGKGMQPEQVQDFIPLPMTLSGCMYYTGMHPLTGKPVYVPRQLRERMMQRALVQYRNPANRKLIQEGLRELSAMHYAPRLLGRYRDSARARAKQKTGSPRGRTKP